MAWAPDYATTTDLKAFVRITDTADDAVLAQAISAASRAIDLYCNRQFGKTDGLEARYYTGHWERRIARWIIPIDDVMAVSGFAVQTTSGIVDLYTFKEANAAAKGRPWTYLVVDTNAANKPTCKPDDVTITAQWGWSSVPTAVKEATLLQASRFFARKDSPYGIAGSPDVGSELRLLRVLDPDVGVILNPYRRWWAAQ